jgi:hypothetical protein
MTEKSERLQNVFNECQFLSRAEFEEMGQRFRRAWSLESCYPPFRPEWTVQNPAAGQCGVTSALVAELKGGELLYDSENEHYWNRLPDGTEQDFTREQFVIGTDIKVTEVIELSDFLSDLSVKSSQIVERLKILKQSL